MKKFVFSLHALLEVKQAQREKFQTEFAAAKAELDQARTEKAAMEKTCAEESAAYETNVKKGITGADLEVWAMYFEELQKQTLTAERRVDRAGEALCRRQAALAEAHQAVKVLEKLCRKQYLAYLAEKKKEESDAQEDILAFQTCGKTARAGSAGTAS